jgi:putative oxidoreductase
VRYLDRLQPLALFLLRLVLGAIMIAHSYPRLFSLSRQVQSIQGLGLPGWLAYVSVAAEFVGGIAVIISLFTRCAALAILIDMGVAIWKVHWKNGFTGNGNYQLTLALAAIAFVLICFGAGPIALDNIRGGGGKKKTT